MPKVNVDEPVPVSISFSSPINEMARRLKKSRRKRVKRSRKVARRGRRTKKNRIITKRLGSRYPLGQRAIVRLPYSYQSYLEGDNTLSFRDSATYTLNSLSTPAHNGTTDSRAAKFLPSQFANYRVIGMKYHLTATKIDGAEGVQEACYMYFIPFVYGSPPNTSAPADIGELQQINMSKNRMLNGYRGAGKFNTLKGYVSCAKLMGDKEAMKDRDYDGAVSITGFWTDPIKLFNYKFGYAALDGSPLSSDNYIAFVLHTEYFVEFFNVSMEGIE